MSELLPKASDHAVATLKHWNKPREHLDVSKDLLKQPFQFSSATLTFDSDYH